MQSSAPDNGGKHRPKHVEPTWNNKLIYIVNLVGYFHSCITVTGFMNVKITKQVISHRSIGFFVYCYCELPHAFNPYPANVENMVNS